MNGFNNGPSTTATLSLEGSQSIGIIGIDQSGTSEECFHCTKTPDKYNCQLLTKEQQPYCSKCFESMFVFESNGKPNDDNNNKAAVVKTKPPPPPKPMKSFPTIPFSTLPKPFLPSTTTTTSNGSDLINDPESLPPPPPPEAYSSMTNMPEEEDLPPPPPILLETNVDDNVTTYIPQDTIRSKTPSPINPYITENTTTTTNLNASTTTNTINSTATVNTNFIRKSPTPKSSSALAAEIISQSLMRRTPSPSPLSSLSSSTSTTSSISNENPNYNANSNNHVINNNGNGHISGISGKVPSPSSSTIEINNLGLRRTPSPLLSSNIDNQGNRKPIPGYNQMHANKSSNGRVADIANKINKYGNSYQTPSSSVTNNTYNNNSTTNNVKTTTPAAPVPTVELSKPVVVNTNNNNTANTTIPAATTTNTVTFGGPSSRADFHRQPSVDHEEQETHLDQLMDIFQKAGIKKKPDDSHESSNSKNTTSPTSKPAITAAKPTTFNCSKCKINLLGRSVESKNGRIYCSPCYRIELANLASCVKCHQGFTPDDPLVTYKNENWHSSCFKCTKCNLPIGAKTFCNQGPEKGLFCADCYFETSGRQCVKCKKYLKSAGYLFRNEPYHQDCFVCTSCNEPIGDTEILCKENDPYCSKCFNQKYLEKCASCHKALIGESVEFEGKQYHDECFKCNHCNSPIGTTSFFPREGKIFCETCYTVKFGKTCKKCEQVIQPGLGLVYKTEQYYHRDCFNCTECSRSLSNTSVHSSKTNDSPYCGECFDLLFSKKCTGCSSIISGVVGSRFISFQDKNYHVECFVCKSCGTSLENRKFAPNQNDILCVPCSKYCQ